MPKYSWLCTSSAHCIHWRYGMTCWCVIAVGVNVLRPKQTSSKKNVSFVGPRFILGAMLPGFKTFVFAVYSHHFWDCRIVFKNNVLHQGCILDHEFANDPYSFFTSDDLQNSLCNQLHKQAVEKA